MVRHYLDHASTSPLRPEVRAAMASEMAAIGGDPGRVHEEGRAVRVRIEEARERVAQLVGVRPRQVVFTSGGTEAINAAVFGAIRAAPGRPVACAAVEHSAVRDASSRAAPIVELTVERTGRIDTGSVASALERRDGERPALVHCQWANHEVATVQPVGAIVELCRAAGVPVHVDACAAVGRVPIDLGALGADLVSISAHKFGGPAGVGALVIAPGSRFDPLIVGGQQERGRRAGFENAPAIAGFGAVAEALGDRDRLEREAGAARVQVARLLGAAQAVDGVSIVGDPDPGGRLPHLVCLGVALVEAEPVVIGLDRAGIAVHSGSACSSEALEPSPVLAAMGVDPEKSLRLSVGWSTTDDDVVAFTAAFSAVVDGLRALRA
ncbi:MAG TPA: cysteine desulfurase family protein [Acidimicrobiales bacterium]|nr:cysteine desulfurase family protein [Acidimicrobiales bacterium]